MNALAENWAIWRSRMAYKTIGCFLGGLGLWCLTLAGWPAPAHAETVKADRIEARMLRVSDGDSFTAMAGGKRVAVRILGIDAPERAQPWGPQATEHLRALLEDRPLLLQPIKRDPFGRTVARVLRPDESKAEQDVGLMMIQAGFAWHFRRYASDQSREDRERYAAAQNRARQAGIGLWSEAQAPQPPWDYRAKSRSKAPPQPAMEP